MRGYWLARALYHGLDRYLLRALPPAVERRARGALLRLARGAFGAHIRARTVGELVERSDARNGATMIPAWAVREIGKLARFEPALAPLAAPGARVELYHVPWDKTYLGDMYSSVRHRLGPAYASMLLVGEGAATAAEAWLRQAPPPRLLIDVVGVPTWRALAARAATDYCVLPQGDLDNNDRAALLTRLVLQLHPIAVRYANGTFVDYCLARHGLALRAVAEVAALAAPGSGPSERPAPAV